MAENPPKVLSRGCTKPLFRSGCTCPQALNFSNNILHSNRFAVAGLVPAFTPYGSQPVWPATNVDALINTTHFPFMRFTCTVIFFILWLSLSFLLPKFATKTISINLRPVAMKKSSCYLFVIFGLLLAGCSVDTGSVDVNDCAKNKDVVDYAQYNQIVIDYLQAKYNVEAEVGFAPDYKQCLSNEAVENLEKYYRFIGAMKKKPICMERSTDIFRTRGMGGQTEAFRSSLNYEKDGIGLTIYYDVDSNGKIADDPRIYAGLFGEGVSNNFSSAWYNVNNYNSSCTASSDKIWVDAVRADYVVMFYNNMVYKFVNGEWTLVPDLQSGLYAKQTIKLSATGMVDLANNQSSLTIQYAGKGSWFFDDLGDL